MNNNILCRFALTLLLAIASNGIPLSNNIETSSKKVICYYDYWAHYRSENKFSVENIDSSLCTHVVYAYVGVNDENKVEVLDPHLQNDLHDLQNFVDHNHGKAKSLIAIGGANHKASKFSRMASTDEGRIQFVESVILFLENHGMNGVIIDWEFPDKEDFENFVKLLDKFDELMATTSFVLGISVSPLKFQIDSGYDAQKFVHFVDFINVLTYDYSGAWVNKTEHASPLYSSKSVNNVPNSQASSLEYWHTEKGVPKEKLILSVPFFGRTWKLFNSNNFGRGALAQGPGSPGPQLSQAGLLSYSEICAMMTANPEVWTQFYDSHAVAAYAVNNYHWVSYENSQTLTAKGKFVLENGFGGVSLFALSYDDFSGVCGEKFGLLKALHKGLTPVIVEPVTEVVVEPAVTTEAIIEIFKCQRNGYFRDYNDCRKWYVCAADNSGVMTQSPHFCEKGFAFDETAGSCNSKQLVKGCEHEI